MLRVRDFGHFYPEGEVGTVGSASFSNWKRLRLRSSTHFGSLSVLSLCQTGGRGTP